MTVTAVQALVTKTAAFNGASLDISAITGDWTLKLRVGKLTAAKKARFVFVDSVDAFTNKIPVFVASVKGETALGNDRIFSVQKKDCPSARFGTGSAVLRLELAEIDGSSSVDYEAWLET